ncbi:hypothetical protein BDN71DRAFT_1355147, partial [Pleurotus eryngii]
CSGDLHEEFRDLEILDDITRLHYIGKLHIGVTGDIRRELIHSFRSLKPKNYMPPHLHRSMCFTKQSPYD